MNAQPGIRDLLAFPFVLLVCVFRLCSLVPGILAGNIGGDYTAEMLLEIFKD